MSFLSLFLNLVAFLPLETALIASPVPQGIERTHQLVSSVGRSPEVAHPSTTASRRRSAMPRRDRGAPATSRGSGTR